MQKIIQIYLHKDGSKPSYHELDGLLSQGWYIKQMNTTATGGEGYGAYIVVLLEK